MSEERGMTAQQRLFVEEYLKDLNGTQAAIRAKYSQATAQQISCRLLHTPAIAEAIEQAMAERTALLKIDVNRVLYGLILLAESDIEDYEVDETTGRLTLREGAPRHATRAVSSKTIKLVYKPDGTITKDIKITLESKNTALANLGRYLAMFVDKVAPVSADGKEEYQGGETLAQDRIQKLAKALAKYLPQHGAQGGNEGLH